MPTLQDPIVRTLQPAMEARMFQGKAIVLYGARQVGKSTLARAIARPFSDALWWNCDETDAREQLNAVTTSQRVRDIFGKTRLVVIDEAQRLRDPGLMLKIAVETLPETQILVTGSSSFDLANKIVEPLTGRKWEFFLGPIGLEEIAASRGIRAVRDGLDRYLRYGLYPEVLKGTDADAESVVRAVAESYLYQDVLSLAGIRNADALRRLVQALALQVGNEVSLAELGQTVGIDRNTAQQYVELLEKSFVIFRLPPLARNLRNELKKFNKIYFWDGGVRNALLRNFNPPSIRTDIGAVWENFCIAERRKLNAYRQAFPNAYFWRAHQQGEVDYVEESGGEFRAWECKWGSAKPRAPEAFQKAYGNVKVEVVNRTTWEDFLLDGK